jgi:hypothetical protein
MLQPKKLGNQRRQNDSARRRGYPSRVTTVQERRGQNMASALICRAMSFFFEKGMNSLALHASGQNFASITLLQVIGFMIGHNWEFMRNDVSQVAQPDQFAHTRD